MNSRNIKTIQENDIEKNVDKEFDFSENEDVQIVNTAMKSFKNGIITRSDFLNGYADFVWSIILRERARNEKKLLQEEMQYLKEQGVDAVLKTIEESLLDYKITAEEVQEAAKRINENIKRKNEKCEKLKAKLLNDENK